MSPRCSPGLSRRTSPPIRASRSRSTTPQRRCRRARPPRQHGPRATSSTAWRPRTDRPRREADGRPLSPYPAALRAPHRRQNEGPTGTVTRGGHEPRRILDSGTFRPERLLHQRRTEIGWALRVVVVQSAVPTCNLNVAIEEAQPAHDVVDPQDQTLSPRPWSRPRRPPALCIRPELLLSRSASTRLSRSLAEIGDIGA